MAEGFIQAGFEIPYATDINEDAAKTYINRHNQLGYSVTFHCGNIVDLANEQKISDFLGSDMSKIDVICGGPPCQGFSLAGQRKNNDPRNQLVRSYIKILSMVQPNFFVMENVTGILSAIFEEYIGVDEEIYKNKKVIEVLMEQFKKIGYNVKYKILNASDFGIPQNRKRVIFMGVRNDLKNISISFPEPLNFKVTAEEAISDLIKIGNGEKVEDYNIEAETIYQVRSREGRTPNIIGEKIASKILKNHETSKHTNKVKERFSLIKPGENLQSALKRMNESDFKKLYTKKQQCKRISGKEQSPTVMTLPDDMIHYSDSRILTVREMARLQSFDDSFEFLGKRTTGGNRRTFELPQYTLVGNAVPPLLANAVASKIFEMSKLIK